MKETFIYKYIESLFSPPPQEDNNFIEKNREAIKDELTNLKIDEKAVSNLEHHLKDRVTSQESEFNPKSTKASGNNEGYNAADKYDDNFMIKKAIREQNLNDTSYDLRNDSFNTMSDINEFVMSEIYNRVLPGRSPIISAVETNNKSKIGLRSKYLPNFQTIAEYTQEKVTKDTETRIGRLAYKLKTVEGAEKLFANTVLFCGDYDIHAGNLGVISKDGEAPVFAKIDHGWAATRKQTKVEDMTTDLANIFTQYDERTNPAGNYGYAGKIDLNISKFIEATDQIAMISNEEISSMIDRKIDTLKKMKFDVTELEFAIWENDTVHNFKKSRPEYIKFNSLDELGNHYKSTLMTHRDLMSELRDGLISIESSKSDEKWKNGDWLHDIKGKKIADWPNRSKNPKHKTISKAQAENSPTTSTESNSPNNYPTQKQKVEKARDPNSFDFSAFGVSLADLGNFSFNSPKNMQKGKSNNQKT